MKIKVRVIVMSHLSDLGVGLESSAALYLKSEFCKWLLLRYENTSEEVDADAEWEEFLDEKKDHIKSNI